MTPSVSSRDGTSPAEAASAQRRLPFVSWLGLAWLGIFTAWFYSFRLPNNPQYTRLEIWRELPWLLWANIDAAFAGETAGRWAHLSQRIDLIAVASFMLAAAWSLGQLALRALRLRHRLTRAERTVFACGVGLAGLSLLTLACGLAGRLQRPLLGSLLAGFFVAELLLRASAGWNRKCATEVDTRPDDDPIADHASPSNGIPRRWALLCLVVATPFLMAMALGAMLPPTDFDVKEYHLQGPKEFFQAGRISFLPHNVYTSFPFGTEMLSLLAMVLRDDWFRGALAGKAVLMSFAPLTALAVFAAGRRWFGPAAGWLALVVHLSCPWTYRTAVIAYAEGGLTFFLIAALLATGLAVEWVQQRSRSRLSMFLLAGLLAGSAMACKYPGLVSVVLPMGTVVAVGSWRHGWNDQPSWRRTALAVSLFSLGTLIAVGPWLAKNLVETGNPVYPLMYSLFGGRDWDGQLDRRWRAAHSPDNFAPVDLARRLVDVSARSDWTTPLLFGLAPLVWLRSRQRRPAAWMWAYVAYLFLTWWLLTHRIDRFWIPMIPVVAVLAGAGGAGGSSRLWHVLTGAVVALAVLFNLGFVTSPLCGFNAYLSDMEKAREAAESTTPGIAFLNRYARLSESATVLTVGEAAVFDARFRVIYNTVFDYSIFETWFGASDVGVPAEERPLRDPAEIRRTLADHGVALLLVDWGEILRYRTTYGYTDFVHPARFAELERLGVLASPLEIGSVPWDELAPARRREVERWAPELISRRGDKAVVRTLAVYAVKRASTEDDSDTDADEAD